MPESVEFIEELVCNDRFCKYVLNPDKETVRYWDEFRKNNPDKEEEIKRARQLVLLLGDDKDAYDPDLEKTSDDLWQKISAKIRKKSVDEHHRDSRNHHIGFILKVAAILFLIGLVSFLILNIRPGFDNEKLTKNQHYFERSTHKGQKGSFYLPDGSHVNLNSGSSLYYYENQETSTRELSLEGEAFFDIKRDPLRPFIVRTKHLSATVLGTSFNVKAYPGETNTKIALVTGKVKVISEGSKQHALTPNQMAVFNRSENSTEIRYVEPENIICWKDNVLLFDEVGLKEIIETLTRWYGVEFVISESLKGNRDQFDQKDYKGKYKDKSLETVLEAISFSYDFDYEIRGNVVLIK